MFSLTVARRTTVVTLMAVAAVAFLYLNTTADAQERRENYGDWTKVCTPNAAGVEECLIFQSITSRDTGRTVLHITAIRIPEAPRPIMVVTVPLGVYLPPGLNLSIDGGAPQKLPIQICGPEGCQSQFEMPQSLFDAFKAGLNGSMVMFDPDGRDVAVPFSLKGFTSAINSLN